MTRDEINRVTELLKDELGPAYLAKVKAAMCASAGLGMDEPPEFPGMPKTGGTMVPLNQAMDAKLTRIVAAASARRSSDTKNFEQRFPDATRLKGHPF